MNSLFRTLAVGIRCGRVENKFLVEPGTRGPHLGLFQIGKPSLQLSRIHPELMKGPLVTINSQGTYLLRLSIQSQE